MVKHTVYCVMGRTASGKTELVKRVAKGLGLTVLKSYTTRPMRAEEKKKGVSLDHIFISKEKAKKLLKGDVVAKTKINGHVYFATLEQLQEADFYIIDPNGYESLEEHLTKESIFNIQLEPIFISVPYKTRMERYIQRGGTTEDFKKRHQSENKQFNQFELKLVIHNGSSKVYPEKQNQANIIKNTGKIEEAVKELKHIIKTNQTKR